MIKTVMMMLALSLSGIGAIKDINYNHDIESISELVVGVEFDTKIDQTDFDYQIAVSNGYSEDLGMSEAICD